MKKTVLIMTWVTILVIGLTSFFAWFYLDQTKKAEASNKELVKELGLACIHHVHNLQNPADSSKKSFYSVGIENVDKYVADAMLQCLQQYPLYGEQAHFSPFNTTLK